jgi:hypothetical protein
MSARMCDDGEHAIRLSCGRLGKLLTIVRTTEVRATDSARISHADIQSADPHVDDLVGVVLCVERAGIAGREPAAQHE